MLHSEYTTSCFMAKSVIWHNLTSKQDKTLFCSEQSLYQPSECKYVLFVCLSVRLQVTLARDFLSALLIYRGKIEIIFRGRCRPRKLKSVKNNRHVFQTKPRKFGDAKISHYTVSLRPVGQSWSNVMCSITGVGERLHQVLGQIGSKLGFYGNRQGSHRLWKTWKMAVKNPMHWTIMEFDNKHRGKITEFWR